MLNPRSFLACLFITSFGALWIALIGEPLYIPDSYEQLLLAECLSTGGSSGINCVQIHPFFRPPFMAFLVWIFSFILPSIIAIGMVAWSASAVFIGTVWSWHAKEPLVAAAVFLCLLTAPLTLQIFGLADARILVLPMTFGAALLLKGEDIQLKKSALAGALLGLAALVRPEAQAAALLFAGAELLRSRKSALVLLACAAVPIALWLVILSVEADQLVLGPRWWEGYLLSTFEFIPRRWTLQLFGMGLFSPEARIIASSFPTAAQGASFNFGSGLQWLFNVCTKAIPIWVLVIGFIGGIRRILSKETRHTMMLLAAFACPNLIAAFLPQAQAPIFPHANLLPFFLVLLFLFAAEITFWCQKIPSVPAARALPFILIGTSGLLSTAPEAPIGIDRDPAGQAAVQWLKKNTTARQSIISSYENAPLIYLSRRKWQQYPAPWEKKRFKKAHYVVLSSLDAFWIAPDSNLRAPVAYFGGEEQWVAIFSLKKSAYKK
ncbi:MAG: hypothetical protein CMK59_02255 [Proteobacteria bacterium]|nr:hypothetical protein [Pseudomonadota bacterium]